MDALSLLELVGLAHVSTLSALCRDVLRKQATYFWFYEGEEFCTREGGIINCEDVCPSGVPDAWILWVNEICTEEMKRWSLGITIILLTMIILHGATVCWLQRQTIITTNTYYSTKENREIREPFEPKEIDYYEDELEPSSQATAGENASIVSTTACAAGPIHVIEKQENSVLRETESIGSGKSSAPTTHHMYTSVVNIKMCRRDVVPNSERAGTGTDPCAQDIDLNCSLGKKAEEQKYLANIKVKSKKRRLRKLKRLFASCFGQMPVEY